MTMAVYSNIFHAIESALQVDGYEVPITTPTVSDLEAETHKHGSRPAGELTRMDWIAQHGMTHKLMIDELGGRNSVQYLTLVNRFCYEPGRRSQARSEISRHLPDRMKPLKKLAVISLWSGQIRALTYADIDCGEGTPAGTLGRHIGEIKTQLDDWMDGAITHLQRVFVDARLIHDDAA